MTWLDVWFDHWTRRRQTAAWENNAFIGTSYSYSFRGLQWKCWKGGHCLFHLCLQSLKSQLDEQVSVEQLQARSSSARRHRACRAAPMWGCYSARGYCSGYLYHVHMPGYRWGDQVCEVYVATSSAKVSAVFWWRIPALCLSALHCLLCAVPCCEGRAHFLSSEGSLRERCAVCIERNWICESETHFGCYLLSTDPLSNSGNEATNVW